MPVYKQIAVFGYALHTPQSTVPIVVVFHVECRTLVYLHQANVSNQQFQLILGHLIHFQAIALGQFEVHAHECTECQVIIGFSLTAGIQPHRLQCPTGSHLRGVEITISPLVGHLVQRIDQTHLPARCRTHARHQPQQRYANKHPTI